MKAASNLPFAAPAVSCEICGASATVWRAKLRFTYHRCAACNYAFISPDVARMVNTHSIYDADYFSGGGAGYKDYLRESTLLREHGRRYGALLARYQRPGAILDCGAAAGFLLRGYVDTGWTGCGLEPNAKMAKYGREGLGVDVRQGRLEELGDVKRFEAISLVQVVAHITELDKALANIARALKFGGVVLVETWNVASITARLFGSAWHEWSPPSVLRIFSPQALARAFKRHDLSPIAYGRPQKNILAHHAKSILTYKLPKPLQPLASTVLGAIPDGIKIRYPADDLFWTIFRQDS